MTNLERVQEINGQIFGTELCPAARQYRRSGKAVGCGTEAGRQDKYRYFGLPVIYGALNQGL